MSSQCPVCQSTDTRPFLELKKMPVLIGVLWSSAEEARSTAKGDIVLEFCNSCGFIRNSVFDSSLITYSESYENSLHYSDVFQEYSWGIVDRLISTYDISNKGVVDIGCGKGDFLAMLCARGNNSGVGFDPSFEGDRISGEVSERLTFIKDLYSQKYADVNADLVTSRYVLEHIEEPVRFLRVVNQALQEKRDAIVYFEVPNVRLILEQLSVWDIIYEHCSYFGRESLAATFAEADFDILAVDEAYDGQFVSVEAKRNVGSSNWKFGDLRKLTALVHEFEDRFRERTESWRRKFDLMRQANQRVVLWGAGAKAVGFLNILELDTQDVQCVVDINPNKHGSYLSGTGQEIISPGDLQELCPDTVILMNAIYKMEVAAQLSEMNLSPELVTA